MAGKFTNEPTNGIDARLTDIANAKATHTQRMTNVLVRMVETLVLARASASRGTPEIGSVITRMENDVSEFSDAWGNLVRDDVEVEKVIQQLILERNPAHE